MPVWGRPQTHTPYLEILADVFRGLSQTDLKVRDLVALWKVPRRPSQLTGPPSKAADEHQAVSWPELDLSRLG